MNEAAATKKRAEPDAHSAWFLLCERDVCMVRLEIGFKPRWLDRQMIRQTKSDVLQRLSGHHFNLLRIVLKKRNGHVAFHFFGEPGSVEKAKALLGIG